MTNTNTSLSSVLSYKNDKLVKYFSNEYSIPLAEARALFNDLKAWLWLSAQNNPRNYPVGIFNDLRVLDLYWHTFLLFTQDYVEFCEKYFGRLIYHTPDTHIERQKQNKKIKTSKQKVINSNLKRLQSSAKEVYNLLGEKYVTRWYMELPRKYGAKYAKKF